MFDPHFLQGLSGQLLYMEPVGYPNGKRESSFSDQFHIASHIQGDLFDFPSFVRGYFPKYLNDNFCFYPGNNSYNSSFSTFSSFIMTMV